MRDIQSEYFPHQREDVVRRLKASALSNARESLVSCVVDLVLKEAMLFLDRYDQQQEMFVRGLVLKALPEVADKHPVQKIVAEKANKIFDRIEDHEIGRLIFLCGALDYLLGSLGNKQQKVTDYLSKIDVEPSPKDDTVWRHFSKVHPDLLLALKVSELRSSALKRIETAGPKGVAEALDKIPQGIRPEKLLSLTENVAKEFAGSESYGDTRDWGELVVKLINYFNTDQLKELVSSVRENNQIYGAIWGEEAVQVILEKAVEMSDELEDELQELHSFCLKKQSDIGIMGDRADFIEEKCPDLVP